MLAALLKIIKYSFFFLLYSLGSFYWTLTDRIRYSSSAWIQYTTWDKMWDKEKLRSHGYHANSPCEVKHLLMPAPANLHAAIQRMPKTPICKPIRHKILKATDKIFRITYSECTLGWTLQRGSKWSAFPPPFPLLPFPILINYCYFKNVHYVWCIF